MSRTRNRIKKMVKTNPYCHWCGTKVREYVPADKEAHPDDMATVDHLYRRWEEAERIKFMNEGRMRGDGSGIYYVLSCNKCNTERSVKK